MMTKLKLASLQADLWILTALLTRRDPRSGQGDAASKLQDFLDGRLYYLSDGGYSRVFIRYGEPPIRLASESSDKIKERWTHWDVINVRHRIDTALEEFHADGQ